MGGQPPTLLQDKYIGHKKSVPHPSCPVLPSYTSRSPTPIPQAMQRERAQLLLKFYFLVTSPAKTSHPLCTQRIRIWSAVDLLCSQCSHGARGTCVPMSQRGAYLPQKESMDPHGCQSQPKPGLAQLRAEVSSKLPRWLERGDGISCSHGRSRSQACRKGWKELQQLPVPP